MYTPPPPPPTLPLNQGGCIPDKYRESSSTWPWRVKCVKVIHILLVAQSIYPPSSVALGHSMNSAVSTEFSQSGLVDLAVWLKRCMVSRVWGLVTVRTNIWSIQGYTWQHPVDSSRLGNEKFNPLHIKIICVESLDVNYHAPKVLNKRLYFWK